jgi:RNA polymerase sigma factor (sigma-70 family)
MDGIGRQLRRVALPPGPETASDGQLLDRFLTGRDEAAFEVLVRRHGRMVLGVCRRVLGNAADAEDAFQVTFLVLVRKGRGLTGRVSVGGWLYRAADLAARKARAQAVRRRTREAAAARPEEIAAADPPDWLAALDREVGRLPAKYRDPVILCELLGETRKEAAGQLGIPEGTLSSRLATAHRLLADRLRRRGLAAPAGFLALAAGRTPTAVPPMLAESAARGSTVLAGFATGSVPVSVHALLSEVTRAMNVGKLIGWGGAILAALVAGGLAWAGLSGDTPRAAADRPAASASPLPAATGPANPPGTVGPPRPGEPAWKAEFRRAYGLADGQALKFVVGDPFPDCREAYLNAEPSPYPRLRHEKLLVVFTSDGRRIVHRNVVIDSYGWEKEQTPRGVEDRLRGRRLWEVLADGLQIAPPLLEADADLTATELYADAVFRDRAPLDQVARSLQAELKEKFEIAVTAGAREEEREVIVARGKYAHRFREGKLNGQVSLAATDLDPDDVRGTYAVMSNDQAGMLRCLGEYVGRPVIDETDSASWKRVIPEGKEGEIGAWTGMWLYRYPRRSRDDVRPADGSADRDAVLKHVAAQTGVTFTTEKRKVWVLSIKKARK